MILQGHQARCSYTRVFRVVYIYIYIYIYTHMPPNPHIRNLRRRPIGRNVQRTDFMELNLFRGAASCAATQGY
jgi:hypothetical protein